VKVPRDPDNPTMADTFKVSTWRFLRSPRTVREEHMRRRRQAVRRTGRPDAEASRRRRKPNCSLGGAPRVRGAPASLGSGGEGDQLSDGRGRRDRRVSGASDR